MLLDRTIDLCAEVLHKPRSEQNQTDPATTEDAGEVEREGRGEIRIRTLFSEAIFIASDFFGAAYRFPFFVVEEDEAGRVAFCFEVFIPFTFPWAMSF